MAALANIPVRGRAARERVLTPGGDTVAVRVTVDARDETTAVAMIDLWGTISRPSSMGPTAWLVRQRADLVRGRGAWVVQKCLDGDGKLIPARPAGGEPSPFVSRGLAPTYRSGYSK